MQTHVVTRIIDGDTVEVSPEISRRIALQTPMERLIGAPLPAETPTERLSHPNMFHKIRLKNIDAPESGTPQGEKAIRYLKQLLEGKRVRFKPVGISYQKYSDSKTTTFRLLIQNRQNRNSINYSHIY